VFAYTYKVRTVFSPVSPPHEVHRNNTKLLSLPQLRGGGGVRIGCRRSPRILSLFRGLHLTLRTKACVIQGVSFSAQHYNNRILRYKHEITSRLPPCDAPNLPLEVTLVARPLLTPFARKLCRCGHVFMSRACVHSTSSFSNANPDNEVTNERTVPRLGCL
jgi:hypothetical protein